MAKCLQHKPKILKSEFGTYKGIRTGYKLKGCKNCGFEWYEHYQADKSFCEAVI